MRFLKCGIVCLLGKSWYFMIFFYNHWGDLGLIPLGSSRSEKLKNCLKPTVEPLDSEMFLWIKYNKIWIKSITSPGNSRQISIPCPKIQYIPSHFHNMSHSVPATVQNPLQLRVPLGRHWRSLRSTPESGRHPDRCLPVWDLPSYGYICVYTYTHIHIYTYIHIYIYTYIHIYIYTYIHVYIYTYIHIYIYIYIYICIYIYNYIISNCIGHIPSSLSDFQFHQVRISCTSLTSSVDTSNVIDQQH